MADEIAQGVLRCGLCNKPFDKQSTLKRHGYYCRSLKEKTRPIRSRSCIACAKAKARCDNKSPDCSRCVAKDIVCRLQTHRNARESFSGNLAKTAQVNTHSAGDDPTLVTQRRASPIPPHSASTFDATEFSAPELDFPTIVEEQFAWEMLDFDGSDIPNVGAQADPKALHASTIPASNVPYLPLPNFGCQIKPLGHTRHPSIPRMPAYSIRSFRENPAIDGGIQGRTAMLMHRILTSYPMMMRSQDSLPPFIHPSFLSPAQESESNSFESLVTCMNLMQMVGTNAPGSRKLLWKNVRLECERLHEECSSLDKWAILSSMQAILIYMLLRLQEGETMHNNLDVLLLSTLWTLACTMNKQIGMIDSGSPFGLSHGTSQKDWIFEESRRRLAVTLRTISMLFSLEPAVICVLHDEFILAPLPARKQLWETRDETMWLIERSRDIMGSKLFGVLRNGDMIKVTDHQSVLGGDFAAAGMLDTPGESAANWQEWCAGMDGLGALIMLAASLPR